MPKKGEKARKLAALSRGKGVRPPKSWFTTMMNKSAKQYPTYGKKRVGAIVGGIWARMSRRTKVRIVKKYQK